MKKLTMKCAMDVLRILKDNPYSMMWEVIEDFEVNGHVVSAKRSTQLKHVIVDGRYHYIGAGNEVTFQDVETGEVLTGIERIEKILSQDV